MNKIKKNIKLFLESLYLILQSLRNQNKYAVTIFSVFPSPENVKFDLYPSSRTPPESCTLFQKRIHRFWKANDSRGKQFIYLRSVYAYRKFVRDDCHGANFRRHVYADFKRIVHFSKAAYSLSKQGVYIYAYYCVPFCTHVFFFVFFAYILRRKHVRECRRRSIGRKTVSQINVR